MAFHELCITPAGLRELVARLRTAGRSPILAPAGMSHLRSHCQWLIHSIDLPPQQRQGRVVLIAGHHPQDMSDQLRRLQHETSIDYPTLVLVLGVNEAAGYVAGGALTTDGLEPLRWVTHVGPGFERTPLGVPGVSVPLSDVLSRTRGALGDAAFRRLQRLHVAVVGCGRTGSLMAESLASLGLSALTFIDPDVIEEHNLGETAGITAADIGRPKSLFLAAVARRAPAAAQTRLTAVAATIQSSDALCAIKEADLIVCCPDNPAARLATGLLSAVYMKPLLDIGTGIVEVQGRREMGADVRLILAGECLLCLGGVTGLPQARDQLMHGDAGLRSGDFREERLGSLRSLNALAAGCAQTLLEQCVSGVLSSSTWLQLNVNSSGLPRVTYPRTTVNATCPLCRMTAGGDGALHDARSLLSQL